MAIVKIYPTVTNTLNRLTGSNIDNMLNVRTYYYTDEGIDYMGTARICYILFEPIANLPNTVKIRLKSNNGELEGLSSSGVSIEVGYFEGKQTKESATNLIPAQSGSWNISGVSMAYTYVDAYTIEVTAPKIAIDNGIYISFDSLNYNIQLDISYPLPNAPDAPHILLNVATPTIANLTTDNADIYKNTIATWTSTLQEQYQIQAIQNDVIVYTSSGTTATSATIPHSTLALGDTTIQVRTGYVAYGQLTWGEWATINQTMTFTVLEPVISNILISGTDIYFNNTITWVTTNTQTNFELQVLQNDVLKFSATGTTLKSVVVPHSTLIEGSADVRIRVASKTEFSPTVWFSYKTSYKNMTFTVPEPSLSNINCSNTDIYYNSIISWDSSNQAAFELQAVKAETVVYSASGTTAKNFNIPANSISPGVTTFKVRLGNKTTYSPIKFGDWQQITTTMVNILPTITSLEPSNISQNQNNNIIISYSAQNYNTYVLRVKQNNIMLRTYIGTTQNGLILSSGTLAKGETTLEMTVTRAINGATATRVSTFNVYGIPDKPTQDTNTLFNLSKPIFTWTSSEQVNAEIIIKNTSNTIIESLGLATEKTYTATTDLLNNSIYFVEIRVKNNYGLWSEWSSKEINTSYTELVKAKLSVYLDGANVRVDIVGVAAIEFMHNEVWRKTESDPWIRIATGLKLFDSITDFTVADGVIYYYKIRSRSTEGAITDSLVHAITSKVNYYNFTDVNNVSNNFVGIFEPNADYQAVNLITTNVFAGNSKPSTEYGLEDYVIASFGFWVDRQELDQIKRLAKIKPILCVRDWHGHRFFGNITSPLSEKFDRSKGGYTISFTVTETDFTDEDLFVSNGATPTVMVLLDGSFLLDGSIDLSGVYKE